jgi:hypothetical protein
VLAVESIGGILRQQDDKSGGWHGLLRPRARCRAAARLLEHAAAVARRDAYGRHRAARLDRRRANR